MATPFLCHEVQSWIERLTAHRDARASWRLLPLLTGFLFATGRRTVSSWLRAGELSDDDQDYYYFRSSLGHKVKSLAAVILRLAVAIIAPHGRILLALDDTPSPRDGPKVEGAGVHHNPTPGPAGSPFLYGHNWVTLAWVVRYARWGAIGLPLLARMYVRQKDIAAQCLTFLRNVTFQTKLVMAAELVEWAVMWLPLLGCARWVVVVDGA
jgi:DDE superfamily endonuclease